MASMPTKTNSSDWMYAAWDDLHRKEREEKKRLKEERSKRKRLEKLKKDPSEQTLLLSKPDIQ